MSKRKLLIVRGHSAPHLAVTEPPRVAQVVAAGMRGPRGQDGANGGAVENFTAGAVISGHRMLSAAGGLVVPADAASISSAESCVGLGLQAAAFGEPVSVLRFGRVTELTWSWAPGPVYLGADGAMTQTPPDTGVLLQVGQAFDSHTLDVRIGTPILLD